MAKVMQLPSQVGGGLMLSLLSDVMKKLGGIGSLLKPVLGGIAGPLAGAFGLPATIINAMFGGPAQAATFDPSKYFDGKSESKKGEDKNTPPTDPVNPTGTLSAAPKGNETGIMSLSGGTPTALSQGSTVSNTQLHHGNEDTRGGLKVRDYFIGGASGPSNGSDGLGARLYSPLGFGPVKYKKIDNHGIAFHDPQTDQMVGKYYHVNDAQHQLDGKVIQPGTLVGTQGGLPGTPSANPGSSSVHLHVEGTDRFHNAVISTYANGNVLKAPGVHTPLAQANTQPAGTRSNLGAPDNPLLTPQKSRPGAPAQNPFVTLMAQQGAAQRQQQQRMDLSSRNMFSVQNPTGISNLYQWSY